SVAGHRPNANPPLALRRRWGLRAGTRVPAPAHGDNLGALAGVRVPRLREPLRVTGPVAPSSPRAAEDDPDSDHRPSPGPRRFRGADARSALPRRATLAGRDRGAGGGRAAGGRSRRTGRGAVARGRAAPHPARVRTDLGGARAGAAAA